MTGDTLKRVRSVRKWLEKAETSYNNDKQISGELNLIMAQAEMQRLKEADPRGQRRRAWGFRAAALCGALLVIGGASFIQDLWRDPSPAAVSASDQRDSTWSEGAPAPEAAPKSENTVSSKTEEAVPPEESHAAPAPSEPPADAHSPSNMARNAASPPVPVMSQKEIQSVVGEAGRALRGQS